MSLSVRNSAQLRVIHVFVSRLGFDFPSKNEVDQTPSSIRTILDNERSEFEGIFTNIKDLAESQCVDFKSEVIITPASIVAAIVGYAEKNNADLIVMGTRGLSGLKKMMLGSVASGFVHMFLLSSIDC
jgi:nucleotide-binding universal stress UspA family protein